MSGVEVSQTGGSDVEVPATNPVKTFVSPAESTPASSATPDREKASVNLLILITGSIAAVKTGLLLDQLAGEKCHIRLASTSSAFHFLHRAQPSKTGIPFKSILTDDQEWTEWQAMNDAVVHIELRRWADLVVIAPLDANTLAKIANGLCDNLVTCVMRAWQVKEKPVIVCPAMNTAMWMHPITAHHLASLESWYTPASTSAGEKREEAEADGNPTADTTAAKPACEASKASDSADAPADRTSVPQPAVALPCTLEAAMFQVVGPVSKRLACGDIGLGGMAPVDEIAQHVRHTMALIRKRKAAVTAAAAAAGSGESS